MAGLIKASDVEEVKRRTNLADLVGDYVTLKSGGVDSMKGLCPFHDERSPSFHVRPALGYYHCFGCGESGDAITFLQRMDHLTFAEAVERLAARIHYVLTYEEGGERRQDGPNRARLLAANQAAAMFFVQQLAGDEGAAARTFLAERGFDPAACERFGVGYAPRGWDGLTKHLAAQGFTRPELAQAGLVSEGQRGVYDRFRGRVVWPIRDTSGQTIGFGARKLYDDDNGPKYLNTPETPVYHKSQVLYGLDLAKRAISRGRRAVVVEGYTDVMACHLAGEEAAVATCGTAFGKEHIAVLRRIMGDDAAAEVVFTFDPDEAGQKAALRAFSEEKRFSAQTYVAVAPDGLDPADLRLHRGDEAVRELFSRKVPLFEFASLPGGQVGFLVVVNILVFLLAFFLDFFELAFILIPLLTPVADKLGIDLVWFAVVLAVNMQTSFIHPPFGFALFYLRSVAPKSVTSSDIYWGAAPYLVIQFLMVGALIAFPQLVGTHAKKDIDTKGVEIPTLEQPGYAPPLFGAPPGQ